ncbi:hypothetical protein NIES4075_60150 [Tolypothrix sp. NIES-4075]|uniref:hypothetical protein n=1 Tax=Tolypothrix sp. NIES-4075 TaxID=2005459 RepID=UPI000B5C54F4|nr:hypothetical protein [Tolypothrix sp. NIES-4075]GAX44996.1 hypothetical protein NIES4075_60150 [Tolypothrix sp. NIES-4075]
MLDSYRELLATTLKNYRLGCVKPIQIKLDSGDLFNEKLQSLVENRLPLKDQLLMRRAKNARNQALIATRRGQFAIASRLFAEARAPLEFDSLSVEGALLSKSFLEQAEAYLDYRCGDFDRVSTRTFEALAIDMILEEEYGYEILHLHRIQLLHNLVRTDIRCMCFDKAIELACQLLRYLEGTLEVLPISGSWGFERVARLPSELVAAMFVQITSEVALMLAGINRQVARDLFAFAADKLQLQALSNSYPKEQANVWFVVKQAFVDHDYTMFLERAANFLVLGRADTPLLWYATVVDLFTLCDSLALPDSKLIQREIAEDAITWQYMPQKFFSLLVHQANFARL